MTLQQAIKEISLLSEEDLSQVIQFMGYLRFCKSKNSIDGAPAGGKKYRIRGGLSGRVVLSDDFHETPEGFKEYV